MKFQLGNSGMGFRDAQGNLTGSHRVGNVRYERGAVIETDQPLDELFRGKFFPVGDDTPVSKGMQLKRKGKSALAMKENTEAVVGKGGEDGKPSSPPDTAEERMLKMAGVKKQEPQPKVKHGLDVTDDFADAELAKMKVFLNPKTDSYIVVDPESGEVLKRVKTDKLVKKFLKSQLG